MIKHGYDLFAEDYPDYPAPSYNGVPVEEGFLTKVADFLMGF